MRSKGARCSIDRRSKGARYSVNRQSIDTVGIPTVKYHTAESVTVKGCQAWFGSEEGQGREECAVECHVKNQLYAR